MVYLGFCLSAWIVFQSAPPDGLSNFPLLMVTFPAILIVKIISLDLWIDCFHTLGLPDHYLINHLYWFLPLSTLQSLGLYGIGRKIFQAPKAHDDTHNRS